MGGFLIPLLLGFTLTSVSAFTTAYTRRWGERSGRLVTLILRMVLGMPLWVVGLGLTVRTPSPSLLASTRVTEVLGWLVIAAGCTIILLALVSLRWQAAAPSTHDTLVQHGLYAHVRHPLYTGMLLEFSGLALLVPTQAVMLACILGIGWVFVQARLEEFDLLQRLPAYREYMDRVPRFLPCLSEGRTNQ
jgi:protein-S-isoprenylcysteine O-methyltransferase Ste14